MTPAHAPTHPRVSAIPDAPAHTRAFTLSRKEPSRSARLGKMTQNPRQFSRISPSRSNLRRPIT